MLATLAVRELLVRFGSAVVAGTMPLWASVGLAVLSLLWMGWKYMPSAEPKRFEGVRHEEAKSLEGARSSGSGKLVYAVHDSAAPATPGDQTAREGARPSTPTPLVELGLESEHKRIGHLESWYNDMARRSRSWSRACPDCNGSQLCGYHEKYKRGLERISRRG